MSTLTKEWLQQTIAELEEERDAVPGAVNEDATNALAAMKLALASQQAKPVAYVDPFAFHNFSVYRAGETDNKRMGREWIWANPDAGLIPVYTAPPAPVAVLDDNAITQHFDTIALETAREIMCDVNRRHEFLGGEVQLLSRIQCRIDDACRSAMLQGAVGNSPVIPDCSCGTCRPVTFTDSRFVVCSECGNKRCPHANDHRNACTGSNEPGQEGSAYPAAPQQEVK